MKILIDEQLPVKLKYRFQEIGHDTFSVRDMGWAGKKNGELLRLAASAQFSLVLTNDKNLYYQQKISSLPVNVLNVNSHKNRYADIMMQFDRIILKLKEIELQLYSHKHNYFMI